MCCAYQDEEERDRARDACMNNEPLQKNSRCLQEKRRRRGGEEEEKKEDSREKTRLRKGNRKNKEREREQGSEGDPMSR